MFSMALSALWFAGSGSWWKRGRTTEALVEEQEEERDVNAFGRQAIRIAAAIAVGQVVSFELAQVAAELIESVCFRGALESLEIQRRDSLFSTAPAAL